MKNIEPVALNPLVESGVEKMIRVIRGKQVLLDRDLAHLYGVETKRINEQVKRNIERFPEEFCFQLEKDEFENWKSQFATSNSDKMGLRKLPFAFSEQGVAMLSAVLHSEKAIRVSIDIMKAFVAMRHYIMLNSTIKLIRFSKRWTVESLRPRGYFTKVKSLTPTHLRVVLFAKPKGVLSLWTTTWTKQFF